MLWSYKSEATPQTQSELTQVLLENRQIVDAQSFFQPASPMELTPAQVGIDTTQLQVALDRLAQALDQQQEVMVFGDYDADGICSTATLWLTLHHLGYKARPFIPHREKHGYGISHKALDDILSGPKPQLIITVDNGIVAMDPIKRLQAEGIDVIVTDHHQPESDPVTHEPLYPAAEAIVHTTQLCGTTVAWMLAKTLAPDYAESLLDLAGIATIADQVPLTGANRSFAKAGIAALKHTQREGLKELLAISGIQPNDVTTSSINFALAPRINAMGRLAHGLEALRLLCTTNPQRAKTIVQTLHEVNVQRQDMTESMIADAQLQAETWKEQHIIVVHSREYHEGVIGLIAGRLMEKYGKPAIVIAVGEVTAKASARSVPGVNIVELIRLVREDLLEVGGHPMAAGFGLSSEKVELVKGRLETVAKAEISAELLVPALNVECELDPELIDLATIETLRTFEPFGAGNPEPLFTLSELEIVEIGAMGKEGKHLKVLLQDQLHAHPITGLAWNKGYRSREFREGQLVNVAGMLEVNEWKNKRMLQLRLKDITTNE